MTRDEWLKAKTQAVSSTESPALFGMSPYLTAYELGIQKQGKVAGELEDNVRMRWGRRLQDSIAQGIADDFNVSIESTEYEFTLHPDEPAMGSSFDYRIVGTPTVDSGEGSPLGVLFSTHGPGLLEIKNVDALEYLKWPEHDAPDHIEIQVQHQMEVARVEWCVLGVLVGGNRTEIYTRMRDGEVGAAILQKVRAFWAGLDRGVLPPPILPQDADIIIKLNQYADPGKLYDGQEDLVLASLCSEYAAAGDVVRQASEAQKSLKAQILKKIGTSERALVEGYNVSASMVAESHVAAHTRGAYRNFRVTKRQEKNGG